MTEANHPQDHHDDDAHLRGLYMIYAALMVLLVLTVGAAFIHKGSFNIVVALAIAVTKASMVIWVFMHVREGGKLVWIFATAAFVWLGILLVLTMSDYLSRHQLPRGDPYNGSAPFVQSAAEQHSDQKKD